MLSYDGRLGGEWRARLPQGLVSTCLPLYPFFLVSLCLPLPIVPGWCVCLSDGLVSLCLTLYPFLTLLVGRCVRLADGLVSRCLPLYPFLFPFVGWCVRLPKHLAPLLSTLSPFLSSKQCTALGVLNAFLRCSPWSCLPLSPTQCLPSCFLFVGWRVRRPGTCLHFFPVVSSPHVCLCWMMCLHSRCLVSPCLPMFPIVFPHVCLCWMVRPPS